MNESEKSRTDFNYVLGDDGRIYQTIDFIKPIPHSLSSFPSISEDQEKTHIPCQKYHTSY